MESALPRWQLHLCFLNKIPVRVHISLFIALIGLLGYSAHGSASFDYLNQFLLIAGLSYFLEAFLLCLGAVFSHLPLESIIITPIGAQIKISGRFSPRKLRRIKLAGLLPYFFILVFSLPDFRTPDISLSDRHLFAALSNLCIYFSSLVLITNLGSLCPLIVPNGLLRYRQMRRSLWLNISFLALSICFYQYFLALYFLTLGVLCLRQMSELRALEIARYFSASEVMIPASQMICFPHGNLLSQAARQVIKSEQSYFPVLRCGQFQGLVSRKDVLLATQMADSEDYIGSLFHTHYSAVTAQTNLADVLKKVFDREISYPLCVVEGQNLCGIILREQLLDFLVASDQSSGT